MIDAPIAERDPTRSIARTALLLLPLQAVFRGGEAVLPLLLAAWFGRSADTDLYYVLSAYFVFASAFITGAFQDSAVVPVLIEVRSGSPERFLALAGSLLGHALAIGGIVALGTGSIAAGAVAFTVHRRAVALMLVGVMTVGVFASGARAFYVGLLNARGVFHAHPLCSGLGTATTLSLLYLARRSLGVPAIPVAIVAGDVLSIALLSAIAKMQLGATIVPNLDRPEPVRRILRLVRLEVSGSLITRINPVVDQLTAAWAGVVGGGTLLRYATDVASLPTSILQATLFPVLLTRLAQEASHATRFARTTRRTLAAVVALLVAASVILAVLRNPISSLLFFHGAMDQAGAGRIADILPWALAGVAPFGALLVLARAHVARQNSRIMPGMGALNSTLNAVLNVALVGPLGLSGIALSTSITYLVVAIVFWVRLPRSERA